jgi:hypothetical protein
VTTTRTAPRSLQGLPTLTEVIELPVPAELPAATEPLLDGPSLAPVAAAVDEEEIVDRVIVELQRHADLMLEFRLREAIEPTLARLTVALAVELRDELSATLRDVVARSVSQELARRRDRDLPT